MQTSCAQSYVSLSQHSSSNLFGGTCPFGRVESSLLVQLALGLDELLPGLVDQDRGHHQPGGVHPEDVKPEVQRVEPGAVGQIVEELGEKVQKGT